MKRLLARRILRKDGVVHPGVAGLELANERDARGFTLGALFAGHGGEATLGVRLTEALALTPTARQQWQLEVSAEETVTALCASRTLTGAESAAVLWVTVAAESKAERKDRGEFLTRLALMAPSVYDAADQAGMDARPLSDEDIARWIGRNLVGDAEAAFPPRAAAVVERAATLSVNGRITATFEVADLEPGEDNVMVAVDEVAHGLVDAYEGEVEFRLADWARPAQKQGVGQRRVGVVSVSAEDRALVDEASRVLVGSLPAKQRLAVRRMWHRQAMAAGASLGAGVLGWQRLEVAA